MTLDNANMAWIAPVVLVIGQLIYGYIQGLKAKKQEQDNLKWQSLQAFVEQNSKMITDIDKRQDKFEMTVRGEYLPRVEFNDFLSSLDKRFLEFYEQTDEREERHKIEMMNLVQKTIENAILKSKVEQLEKQK